MLGREDEERRAEQRVGPRGEDRVVDAELLAAERDLGTLRAPDPVALHPLDVLGPVDRVEVGDEAVRVVGDAEEPLLELTDLHERAGALAAPVDDLLVGQDGLLDRVPVDRGLLAVGEAVLEQLQEDPLRPAVVARLVRAELARPVDRDAPLAELPLEGGDRLLRRLARMLAGADRVVLRGQAERVVAHRVQHPAAGAPVEVRDGVADGVDLQVPDVRLAAGVRQHLEHVGLRPRVVGVVGDLPGVLVRPHLLPAGLDLGRVVAVVGHLGREDTSAARPTTCGRSRPPAGPSATRCYHGVRPPGAIAQLGERLHGMQEVGGSSPPSSTSRNPCYVGGFVVQAAYADSASMTASDALVPAGAHSSPLTSARSRSGSPSRRSISLA